MSRFTFSKTLLTLLLLLAIAPPVLAHGTDIRVTVDGATIQIAARFETDEPMSDAQIIVYAPDNPQEPWLSGVADTEGAYAFDLDPTLVGEWAITIRTGGHGEIVHLDVSRNGSVTVQQNNERSAWQTALMAGAVVAALGGVAFYFNKN